MSPAKPRPLAFALLAAACAAMIALPRASAAVLLRDAFAQPDGPLESASGWIAGVPPSGGPAPAESKIRIQKNALVWDGAPRLVNTVVFRPLVPAGRRLQGLVFVGLVLNVSATPSPASAAGRRSSGAFLALCNDRGNSQRVMLGLAPSPTPGHFRLSLGHSQAIADADLVAGDFPAGQDLRLVVGHDFARGVSSVWINPTGEDVPASHAAAMTASTGLSSLAVRMLNNANDDLGTLSITRLVAATTFAEALPGR